MHPALCVVLTNVNVPLNDAYASTLPPGLTAGSEEEPTVIAPYALDLLAETRGAELRREARAARLAAIAACCRPSSWARTARGGLDTAARLRRTVSLACCATA